MRRLALLLSLPTLLIAAPEIREMTLRTADGFTLQGTLMVPEGPGKHPVVILAHQFRSDRSGWAPVAQKLLQRGVATLALDLRGHGASTQKNGTTVTVSGDFDASAKAVGFDQIPEDLLLAAIWVRKQPGINARRLGLAGSSVGATSVMLASPQVHPVAILALSPGGDTSAIVRATELGHAAVMLFASAEDKTPAQTAAAIHPILGAHIRIFDGGDHGFAFLKDHSDVMAVFLAEYLTRKDYGPSMRSEKAANPNVVTNATLANPGPAEVVK